MKLGKPKAGWRHSLAPSPLPQVRPRPQQLNITKKQISKGPLFFPC